MSDLTQVQHPDDEGGPRQSFWSHLEELRKAIIRSVIAIGLAMVLCLLFTHKLVAVLEYPLRQMDMFQKPTPSVTLKIGDRQLGPFPVSHEQFAGLPPGDAPQAVFEIGTATIGEQQVATLKLLPPPTKSNEGPLQVKLHNFSPAEAFFVAFHVALYGALVLSAPFWIYFMGGFIMPALRHNERQALLPWAFWSCVLFLFGILSTYFILLPVALRASVMYSSFMGFEGFDWRADEYIRFVTRFLFGMGLGFQFPIIVLFLVKIGMVTRQQLGHYRRHVLVFAFVIGALLTTPEVITQVAMAIPLYLLYEVCILVAWYWEWKKKRAAANAAK